MDVGATRRLGLTTIRAFYDDVSFSFIVVMGACVARQLFSFLRFRPHHR